MTTLKGYLRTLILLLLTFHLFNSNAQETNQLTVLTNQFADKFLNENYEENSNYCFSPFLMSSMLGWLELGAKGETLKEFREASGFVSDESFINDYKVVFGGYQKTKTLYLTNALWPSLELTIGSTFLEQSKEINSLVERLNYLNTDAARSRINQHISDNTNKMIPELLPKYMLSPSTVLVLTNSLYFKDAWAISFKKELTFEGDFTLSDKTVQKTKMMKQVDISGHVFFADNYSGICIPFKDEQFSFIAIQPTDKLSINQLLSKNVFERLPKMIDQNYDMKLAQLVIPKFKASTDIKLVPAWQKLGISRAFSDAAEFDKISGGIFISDGIQKTVIEISEEGVEAASATAVVINRSAGYDMIFNRPFVYAIYDNKNKIFLLVGVYDHPE